MAQTLKDYIEAQRKLGATPYFTNLPPEEGGPADVFRYEEKPFTEATERELEDPLSGFSYSEDVPGLIPEEPQEFSMAEAEKARRAPPPKPTAETVTPGAPVPGSTTGARYATDQKTPKTKEKIPAKPPAEELTPQFKDRVKFRDRVASNIEKREGYNPLTFNYIEEAERQTSAREPDLFRKVFGGRKAYHMKDFLTPEEKKVWRAAVQDDAAMTETKLKMTSDRVNKALEFGMKKFDDTKKEVGKLQVTMKQNLKPLFVTVTPEGKEVGQIAAGVLPKAVARATNYVHGGMSAIDAGNKVTQELMAELIQAQTARKTKTDALAKIQGGGSWTTKADMDMAATASGEALKAGATREEVYNELLALNYKEHQIKQILPAEGAIVSRETKSKVREIKEAYQRGDYGTVGSAEAKSAAKTNMASLTKG